MSINHFLLVLAVMPMSMAGPLFAHELERDGNIVKTDPEQVFAYQGDAVLTQTGIDAAFSKIAPEHRLPFIRDGAKVDQMVKNLLKAEVIARDAMEAGFDEDPLIRERIIQAARKELAEAWIEKLAQSAPEADYEAMAYEDYLANPDQYSTEEILDVSHVLIGIEGRTEEEAKSLAESLRAQLVEEPGRFESMVAEYSDDPMKSHNHGTYRQVRRGRMVGPFEDAAFALAKPGDLSEPVRTDHGYHIIRLDRRFEPRLRSFEEVREEAIARARQRHQQKYQADQLRRVLAKPIVIPDGAVEIMLKRYFGENLENAPRY